MNAAQRPWYREPWPWLLMLGPALVIVAGAVTVALAVVSDDGVIAEDYYKRGLAIDRVLARDARARELGLSARVPKFVRRYGELGPMIEAAIQNYADDVRSRAFPGPENVYGVKKA